MSSLEANIVNPHDHDVLSGRGNFVNYHAGNEHFRGLVRKHKVAYVACPKPQKGKFSRMIVDEIRSRNPPGRFLKQDAATKLWYDIGEKKSLDKTRQALREGAPEIVKELSPDGEDSGGEDEDSEYPNSPRASISSHSQQVIPQPVSAHSSIPINAAQVNGPGNEYVHPGHYAAPPQVSSPYAAYSPAQQPGGRIAVNPSGALMRDEIGPPQVSLSSNPSPQPQQHHQQHQQQRVMQNGAMLNTHAAPSNSQAAPIRSLAGIRQAMQQQRQQQVQHNMYLSNQGGGYPGMGSYASGAPSSMLDELEPRPIASGGGFNNNNNNVPQQQQQHQQQRPSEPWEPVGPLPVQRFRRERQQMQKESSDRSINMDNIDKVFYGKEGGAERMNNSAVSIMSLSIGDIATRLAEDDGSQLLTTDSADGDQLAPLFDSSLRLGMSHKKKRPQPPQRTGSSDNLEIAKVMDMSVATLGGELSEVGDASMARMTASAAEMSFTNVFED